MSTLTLHVAAFNSKKKKQLKGYLNFIHAKQLLPVSDSLPCSHVNSWQIHFLYLLSLKAFFFTSLFTACPIFCFLYYSKQWIFKMYFLFLLVCKNTMLWVFRFFFLFWLATQILIFKINLFFCILDVIISSMKNDSLFPSNIFYFFFITVKLQTL